MGFPVIFSRLWWPIEPKFSQVCVQVVIHEVWVFGQYCFIDDVLLLKREPPAKKNVKLSFALHYFSNWYENCWVLLGFFFWGGWGRVSIYNGVKGHYVWCPSTSFMFHSICCFLGHDDVIGAVVSGGMLWRNDTHFKVQEYNLRVSLFSWC